jgi:ubiquinone/menaquinone biosynthesis C-methylase UbiE
VLDAGTGTGTRLEHLKQRIPGSRMFALDVSPAMAHTAKEKDTDGIIIADMSSLPLSENSFNYVFCFFNSFGYIPSESRRLETLKEFYRVLAPGGAVLMDVLNRWHSGEGLGFKKSKRQISKELAFSRESRELEEGDVLFSLRMNGDIVPGYFHSFTKRGADNLFKQVGFTIEDFQIIGYDSGLIQQEISRGNLFYVLRKPEEK